jgi:hypothetical protein
MKTKTMMVMMAAGLAAQGLALGSDLSAAATTSTATAATTTTPSASANVQRIPVHTAFSLFQLAQPKSPENFRIERYGNISSRPWAQTVGFSAAPQTQFMGDRERLYEPNFNLLWVGRTPR